MKLEDLKEGQTYQIGEGFYTFKGYMSKGKKVVFWVRQDGPESPVMNTVGMKISTFREVLEPYINQ